jgi:hypothetical protein
LLIAISKESGSVQFARRMANTVTPDGKLQGYLSLNGVASFLQRDIRRNKNTKIAVER